MSKELQQALEDDFSVLFNADVEIDNLKRRLNERTMMANYYYNNPSVKILVRNFFRKLVNPIKNVFSKVKTPSVNWNVKLDGTNYETKFGQYKLNKVLEKQHWFNNINTVKGRAHSCYIKNDFILINYDLNTAVSDDGGTTWYIG